MVQGPCLIEYLETANPREADLDAPMRFPVQCVSGGANSRTCRNHSVGTCRNRNEGSGSAERPRRESGSIHGPSETAKPAATPAAVTLAWKNDVDAAAAA